MLGFKGVMVFSLGFLGPGFSVFGSSSGFREDLG